jgi:hypothetical protein
MPLYGNTLKRFQTLRGPFVCGSPLYRDTLKRFQTLRGPLVCGMPLYGDKAETASYWLNGFSIETLNRCFVILFARNAWTSADYDAHLCIFSSIERRELFSNSCLSADWLYYKLWQVGNRLIGRKFSNNAMPTHYHLHCNSDAMLTYFQLQHTEELIWKYSSFVSADWLPAVVEPGWQET